MLTNRPRPRPDPPVIVLGVPAVHHRVELGQRGDLRDGDEMVAANQPTWPLNTAAYRMAEDPALPLTNVQLVLGHAQLSTTQIYLTPRKKDVIRRLLACHTQQTRLARERPGRAARRPGSA
jgi:hypothetical protein